MHILAQHTQTLKAQQQFVAGHELRESLTVQAGAQRLEYARHERVEVSASAQSELRQMSPSQVGPRFSEQARALEDTVNAAAAQSSAPATATQIAPDEASLHKLRMLLVALGRSVEEIDQGLKSLAQGWTLPAASVAPTEAALPSLEYHYEASFWQGQSLNVSIEGCAQTADGRTLNYGLSLEMHALEVSRSAISIRAGALTDPLVLNLSGQGVALSEAKMHFDLNADGKADSIAMLASDSAYLALDRNQNGQIDNGHELFGAKTGDGFNELAEFDQDGNGFIDEADAIFSQLKLWRPDANGQGTLVDLLTAGVGAIGLARAYGEFDLVSAQSLAGRVKSTGLFFFESGKVGSIQQIDLAC